MESRTAREQEGKDILEATEMEEGEGEENLGDNVPEKAEKEMKAAETIDGDAEDKEGEKEGKKEDVVREGGVQTVQELSSIKVKVRRFDSHDVTDNKSATLDGADVKASSVDETDAKKIKDFFSKHQEEPLHRDHGNEVNF